MHSLEFIDKEMPVYKADEKIEYKIDFSAKKDIENLRMYYTICNIDSTIVGTMQSDSFGSISAGERRSCEFSMDVSNLVAGEYYFILDIFSMNEYGTHISYDHPVKKVFFEIEDSVKEQSIHWQRRYFGSVRLAPISVVSKND